MLAAAHDKVGIMGICTLGLASSRESYETMKSFLYVCGEQLDM
jgi:hypothetical protein